MEAFEIVQEILSQKKKIPVMPLATAFAPANIALIKYWGKRDTALNLPMTQSLSIALPSKGTTTTIHLNARNNDRYYLNGELIDRQSEFAKRLKSFCDFFRFEKNYYFDIITENNVPTAAGLASSASGFAALILAFDRFFGWHLEKSSLSILARLGSGSACRSLWNGLVVWQKGERNDGLDSYAYPLPNDTAPFLSTWCVGLLIFEKEKKKISSRQAMLNTVNTSPSYKNWPKLVAQDFNEMTQAISQNNFSAFGDIAERNALAMHATMLDSDPSTNYCTPQTTVYREKIWRLRQQGLSVYFTQDAGPNLKLLFPTEIAPIIQEQFPAIEMITL